MSIGSWKDLEGLRERGRIVRAVLIGMERHVRPGVTSADVNAVGAAVLRRHGARSAPVLVYGFPTEVRISVNEEIVHGIPSRRVIRDGDLVKLDVTVEKDGDMADAAITAPVGGVGEEKRHLIACARRAFLEAMRVARVGHRVRDIGPVCVLAVVGMTTPTAPPPVGTAAWSSLVSIVVVSGLVGILE